MRALPKVVDGSDASGALLYSGFDSNGGIQVSRFFPECSRLFPSQDCQAANGVCQVAWGAVLMLAIETQGLKVTAFCQGRAALFVIDIAKMPYGMGKKQWFFQLRATPRIPHNTFVLSHHPGAAPIPLFSGVPAPGQAGR